MTAPTSALAAIGAAPETGRVAAVLSTRAALAGAADHGPEAVRGHLAAWAGRPVEELLADGVDAFRRGGAARLRYEAWDLIQAHRRRGHAVVLLTPLSVDRVAPVADELGIEHVLATGPEISDGRLTGRVGRSLLGAPAREDALATFAAEHGIDLGASFAYAGSPLEAGLLRAVGHPVALAPDRGLRVLAATNGWPVVEALDRSPGTTGALRTAASYAAFLTATGVGLTAGLAARRRRPGVDAMSRTFARLGPALSGIHIDVRGEEHLRSHRPAVFLINHQSHLVDAIVAFRLLDHNFTVVAKKEVRAVPVLGQATWLADWAYVSRVGDRAEARAAIGDAVAKLEQGISVILAPEGTRSVGPRVGPFKKGAFYMAREAGVPVVPIIIRNSGELMWRDAKTLKPGTVEVVVHPPITCDWTDDEFTDRVVRYLDQDHHGRPTRIYTELETAIRRAKATLAIAYDEPHTVRWTMTDGNVPAFDGAWRLSRLDASVTRAEYELAIDFGSLGRLLRGAAARALGSAAASSMPTKLKSYVERHPDATG